AACNGPKLVAEELLRADGFTVQSVKFQGAGKPPPVDFYVNDAPNHVMDVEDGRPRVALAGFHSGCYELFGTNQVRSIRDLKGKTVAVPGTLRGRRVFLAFDPEDTIRFYALRLREANLIKNSAQRIIAEGTDWRFLNELKKELKA